MHLSVSELQAQLKTRQTQETDLLKIIETQKYLLESKMNGTNCTLPTSGNVPQNNVTQRQKRRCIFVDCGANVGDSFRVFMKEANTKFYYDYPIPSNFLRSECESYLIEGNPAHTPALKAVEEQYKTKTPPVSVTVFPNTAVWIESGVISFYLDTVNGGRDYWGSSLNPAHPDAIKSGKVQVNVTSMNLADFLLRNFLPQDYVLVKVDIEGSEWDLLPHLLQTRSDVVIDLLLVEWHDFLKPVKFKTTKESIINEFNNRRVSIPPYDTPARK